MKALYFCFAFFLFTACNKYSSSEEGNLVYKESEIALAAPPVKNGAETFQDTSRKIIKSANISIETDSLENTVRKINQLINGAKGYVEEEQNSGGNDYRNIQIKCRIPATGFEDFIAKIDGVSGKITHKNIKRTDVTREYIETETSLNSQKELEKRYVQLLAKATKISDMLEIESKLNEIKTSIDFSQNHLNSLKKQIKYSDVEINISNSVSRGSIAPKFGAQLKDAFANGFSLLKGLAIGIITLWPLWIIIIIAVLVYRKLRKRKN